MKKINLKTKDLASMQKRKKLGTGPLVLGMLLLVLGLGSYAAVYLMSNDVEKNIDNANKEIQEAKDDLNSDEFFELYSFQAKLMALDELLLSRGDYTGFIDSLSKHVLSDVYFQDLSGTDEEGVLSVVSFLVVPDYNVLSRQLEAFSLIDGIGDVLLDSSKQVDNGLEAKVVFQLDFSANEL